MSHVANPGGAAEVDHSANLTSQMRAQYGGSCHVLAAVELFETACFRATGKHVRLSSAYLLYRHLRRETAIDDAERPWELAKGPDPKSRFTGRDGSTDYSVLNAILAGDVCTEGETADQDRFYKKLSRSLNKTAKEINNAAGGIHVGPYSLAGGAAGAGLLYLLLRQSDLFASDAVKESNRQLRAQRGWCRYHFSNLVSAGIQVGLAAVPVLGGWGIEKKRRLSKEEKAALPGLREKFDEVACDAFSLKAADDGCACRTKDPALQECLNLKLKPATDKMSDDEMIEHLKSGETLECGAEYSMGWRSATHTALVVGYRKTTDGKTLFLIHNGNVEGPNWWSSEGKGCGEVTRLVRQ